MEELITGPGNVFVHPRDQHPEEEDEEEEEDANDESGHGCYCNSCGVDIVTIRFKCCHCLDFDFCNACFQKWLASPNGEFDPLEGKSEAEKRKSTLASLSTHFDFWFSHLEPCPTDCTLTHDHVRESSGGVSKHDKTHIFIKLHTPKTYSLTAVEEDEDDDESDEDDDEDEEEEEEEEVAPAPRGIRGGRGRGAPSSPPRVCTDNSQLLRVHLHHLL